MNDIDSTQSLIISGIMGVLGGLITIPINAIFAFWLKKYELEYGHRLDEISKQRELLLQHKLEMERLGRKKNNDSYSKSSKTKTKKKY